MLLAVLLVIALSLCLIHINFRYNRAGRLMSLIPGPKTLPFVGNTLGVPSAPKDFFKFLRDCVEKYGGSVCSFTFLNKRLIHIYEPEDIEVVLSSNSYKFHEKPVFYTFLRPWLGEGLLTSSGAKWKHRRKLLTPAFHFNILKKFTHTFQDHAIELVDLIKSKEGEQSTVVLDLKPTINNATLNIMCETSMGIPQETEKSFTTNKYFQAIHTLANCIVLRIANPFYIFDVIYNWSENARTQKKVLKDLHSFTDEVIKTRRECIDSNEEDQRDDEMYGRKGKMALLDLLLAQENEGNIDEQGIREEVDTFMFEGHDTTSSTLRFFLMRIAHEPVIQGRIYDELKSIFGDSNRTATLEDLSEMKYLERCIKESLRLYPGVPYVGRMLREETVLNGYTVPANTMCSIHIFDVHRREKLFSNAEEFDPDRFLPENVAKMHPYAYIPFSAGPRNCIGQKFAMLEIKTVTSALLRNFRLEPVTKMEDIVFVADFVLQARDPIFVKFVNRHVKQSTV